MSCSWLKTLFCCTAEATTHFLNCSGMILCGHLTVLVRTHVWSCRRPNITALSEGCCKCCFWVAAGVWGDVCVGWTRHKVCDVFMKKSRIRRYLAREKSSRDRAVLLPGGSLTKTSDTRPNQLENDAGLKPAAPCVSRVFPTTYSSERTQ